MSDLVTGGASGGIVAIFILGANWAKSFFKGNGNGNGKHASEKEIKQAEEIATLKQQVSALSNMPSLHNGLMQQVTEIATILNKGVVPELAQISNRLASLERRT